MSKDERPKTIDDAIDSCMGVGPLADLHESMYRCMEAFIRQKFNNYLFKAESEETKQLMRDLFRELTVRKTP